MQPFVFWTADWNLYDRMLSAVNDRHVRITYDRGRLELMAPSLNHEWWSRRLDSLIRALAEELGMDFLGGGMTTFRREDLDRGLEPDQCYFIASPERVRGRQKIDLSIDPPPDLALEIDISTSSLDRMGIYAALGVQEVWRCDGVTFEVRQLSATPGGRDYVVAPRSTWFPLLPADQVMQFLIETQGELDIAFGRMARAWVRAGFTTTQGGSSEQASR
jgi:Uma2 family endonuclease